MRSGTRPLRNPVPHNPSTGITCSREFNRMASSVRTRACSAASWSSRNVKGSIFILPPPQTKESRSIRRDDASLAWNRIRLLRKGTPMSSRSTRISWVSSWFRTVRPARRSRVLIPLTDSPGASNPSSCNARRTWVAGTPATQERSPLTASARRASLMNAPAAGTKSPGCSPCGEKRILSSR